MRSAAREPEQDAPREPAREDPRIRAAALAARYEAVLRALEAGGNGDLMFEVIVLGRRYAEHAAAMERLLAREYDERRTFAAGVALGESRTAARQDAPGPRRAAGRAWLNVVRSLAPAGAIGIAAKTWAAHRVLAPVALAAMTAAPAAAVIMAPARTAPDYASTAPAPAASIYSATPAVTATPAARTQPRGAVTRSRPLTAAAPRPPVPAPRPSLPAPASASPSASPAPAALAVSTAEIGLGEYMSATLSLAAPAGAVAWSASCTPGVSLSSSAGILAAGQQGYQLTVRTIAAGGEKYGWCTFWPGGTRVLVTWA